MAKGEQDVIMPADVGKVDAASLANAPVRLPTFKDPQYGGGSVEVVRAANAGDGADFNPSQPQLLIRVGKDRTKKVVALSEVTEGGK